MQHGRVAYRQVRGAGRTKWGEYKLTPTQRQGIRILAHAGEDPHFLARWFGVHVTTISAIVNGKGSYGQ